VTKEDITRKFREFNQKNILIIGDIMLDAYLIGTVDRISPEAPIPIVSVADREYRLGGAANVALNIKALGANPIVCSVIGNDESGDKLFNIFRDNSLDTSGIYTSSNRKTTRKSRIISSNQHLLRVDEEITSPLNVSDEKTLKQTIYKIIADKNIHAVVFQDYDKGVITKSIIEGTIDRSISLNIPVFVDPKRNNFFQYKNSTVFKPNFKEFIEAMGIITSKTPEELLIKTAKKFIKENKIEHLLLTLSEEGILIVNKTNHQHLPAEKRDITDVSGAGDTVISTATLCHISGFLPADTALISNLAGGIVCEKPGVVTISKEKLLSESINHLVQ